MTLFSKPARWGAGLVVASGAALGIAASVGPERPPPLDAINRPAAAFDLSGLPAVSTFVARDGATLAYRLYPGGSDIVAVAIHGSSASGAAVHLAARALAQAGVTVYAPDVRGHGASGPRGDISHSGQLLDDVADLVEVIEKAAPGAKIVAVGHSSGGGFALRIAGSPVADRFSRFVLLAPFLGPDAPTSRKGAGGWARASVPRIVALSILCGAGATTALEGLPVLAFAVPAKSDLTGSYSFRLFTDFRTEDFRRDLAASTAPIRILVGADDEIVLAERYADVVAGLWPRVSVEVLPGVAHMGIIADPGPLSRIVAAVRGE